MELFNRRYLCFICFVFLFISVIVFPRSSFLKALLLILLSVACIVLVLCFLLPKQKRFSLLVSALSLMAACVALFNSLVFVSAPKEKALKYVDGTYSAELEILSLEYSDELSSEYNVRVLQIGGDKVNIKSYLVCEFDSEFSYGDRVIAVVEGESVEFKSSNLDNDILLYLCVDSSQPIMYAEKSQPNIFSFEWIRSKTGMLRNYLCEYIDEIFDEDGALVKGMLINEKSDISIFTKSQFRRAGASHLLAVSGLHISLLLGAFEMFLRRIFVPKKIRIFIILIGGIAFVAMTDFSPSALRATLMLFAVYLNYMLAEENDSVSALFASVALICLFSPFSVCDVGLWLSFGATLGLVAVYPYLYSRIFVFLKRSKKHKKLLKIIRLIIQTLLLTAVANVFVLPLMWYFFGEISLASLPCNLILSPLTALFLPMCVLSLIFGGISFVGRGTVLLAKALEFLILRTVSLFADMRGALLSLEYPFAAMLVMIFSISMAILMVIKLKHKSFICLPPTVFAVLFATCMIVFSSSAVTQLRYVGKGNDEIIFFERAGRVSVCDMSNASSSSYWLINDSFCEYSTEIEDYVIADLSGRHADMLGRIYDRVVIRRIYIPLPQNAEEGEYCAELCEVAQRYNTSIILYDSGEQIPLFDDVSLNVYYEYSESYGKALTMCFYNEEKQLTYANSCMSARACTLGSQSKYFLVGRRGDFYGGVDIRSYEMQNTSLIFADKSLAEALGIVTCYVPKETRYYTEFSVVIE